MFAKPGNQKTSEEAVRVVPAESGKGRPQAVMALSVEERRVLKEAERAGRQNEGKEQGSRMRGKPEDRLSRGDERGARWQKGAVFVLI